MSRTARLSGAFLSIALVAGAGAASAREHAPEATLRTRLTNLVARPGGLRASEVATRAVATSYDLRQRRDELTAAAAQVDQALVAWFPRVALSARYARLSPIDAPVIGNLVVAPPGTPTYEATGMPIPAGTPLLNHAVAFPVLLDQTTLQATLQLPLLDYVLRIPAANRAAKSQRDAAKWSARATQLQIATDARAIYYQWARARLQVAVAEQALVQVRGHHESARHAFDAGAANKADVMRVAAQVASTELFLERARNLEAVLAEELRTAMHDERGARDGGYEIGEDLRLELQPLPLPQLASLVDEAWRGRAEVRVLEASQTAQAAQASVARAGILPRLDAFGDVISANPNPRFLPQRDRFDTTWDVGAQLSISPNDVAAAAFAGRAAFARARAIGDQLCALRDRLRLELMRDVAALREAEFAVQSTARGLDAAEESYRARRDLYGNGRATSIELTDAETDLTQARLNAVGARIDQRVARIRILHALGRDGEIAKD